MTAGGWQRLAIATIVLAIALVVWRARTQRTDPARCPEGRIAMGSRCCWTGQSLIDGRCHGPAEVCPAELLPSAQGCLVTPEKVEIPRGQFTIARNDWQSSERDETITSLGFMIDRTEVTVTQWAECTKANACTALKGQPHVAPSLPASGVTNRQAEAYCRWAGGRLPTRQEWIFAASGGNNRRYPWGQTGLVCRRSVFGLVRGPCAAGGDAPESVGSRPAGATPTGLFDMAGNVAEWVTSPQGPMLMGGSFRSELASELKIWSMQRPTGDTSFAGLRCVYPNRNQEND